MRILHVADLHHRLEWYEWVRTQTVYFDVLVIAGDLLNFLPTESTPLQQQARFVRKWLGALPKASVVCTGNHDVWSDNPLVADDAAWADGDWLQLCKREGVVVDGESARIGEEHFSAVRWGHSDWQDRTSVVVVHSPPAHTRISADASGEEFGNPMLNSRIVSLRPKYVLSGHVHSASDWIDVVGPSYCFNPGCDWMALVPNHIFIDTTARTARWFTAKKGYLEKRLDAVSAENSGSSPPCLVSENFRFSPKGA